MTSSAAIQIQNLRFAYKEKQALDGVSFSVGQGEIFSLLGPNGSGKTTLFRILSTALPVPPGVVHIEGLDLASEKNRIREKLGVVFQSPSLDGKLTVRENLIHQGHLYGLSGRELRQRMDEMLLRLGLRDRARDLAEKLSGGLKRRVELAKGLLHRPTLLILDEPSTGLDPGAKLDLWRYLQSLKEESNVTILVTTHLMDEAERSNRLAILNEGKLIKLGKPEALKKEIGGDVLVIKARETEGLAGKIRERFKIKTLLVDGTLQIEHAEGAQFVARLAETFPGEIESITFRKPTLEDVFIHETGHRFWGEAEGV